MLVEISSVLRAISLTTICISFAAAPVSSYFPCAAIALADEPNITNEPASKTPVATDATPDGNTSTDSSASASSTESAKLKRPYRSVRDVVYSRVDGTALTADVFRPASDELAPVVLMIHGGAWSSGDKWHLHDHARELAQEGYVAISINYRLAPLHTIEKQIDDCRAALKWLDKVHSKYNFDTNRIAVWGYSAGAHLSCMLATRPAPDAPKIRAVIGGGTPCDFENIPPESPVLSLVMGGTRKEIPQVYHDVSPVNFVNEKCPPTLFFHGTADALVPQATSRRMHEALLAKGVESEYVSIEGKGHLTTFIDGTARRKAIEFLNKHLHTGH